MDTDKKKRCSSCRTMKLYKDFHKNRTTSTGRQHSCRKCRSVNRKNRREVARTMRIDKVSGANSSMEITDMNNKLPSFEIDKEIMRDGKLHHFSMIMVGQSRSGKTTSLIDQLNKIDQHYDIVMMISQSMHAPIYKNYKFDVLVSGKYYKKIIAFIRKLQKLTENKLNILMVFDDFSKNCKVIRNLYTNARNSKISIISLVQDSTMINNHCRYNTLYCYLFQQKNSEASLRIYEFWLRSFVTPPKILRTQHEKREFLIGWFNKVTADYHPLVLNIDKGSLQTSHSEKID